MPLLSKHPHQNLIQDSEPIFHHIFPEYGTAALDIPYYDSEKHMYIMDQYTSESGNRHVTYVAVGRHLCVEVTLTMYHSWTLMSSMRVMIPNFETLKVVKTFEWPKTTYYDVMGLCQKIRDLVQDYANDNLPDLSSEERSQMERFVDTLVCELLGGDLESHDKNGCLMVLGAYCRQMKVCKDFVTF